MVKIKKRALLIIASENFRDEEFFETQKILEASSVEVEVASEKAGIAKGMLGGKIAVEKNIFDVNIADYQAVVFIGGSGAASFFENPIALAIAEEAERQNKVLAAICIAPSILANAGVLKGKKVTAFPTEKDNLLRNGADFVETAVAVDGKIITASGPKAVRDFAWKIVELLSQKELKNE